MDMESSSARSASPAGPIAREKPTYISVDVETSGPNPHEYSLLSIGACTFTQPRRTFYVELKPVTENALPEAMEISGLALAKLLERGLEPEEALKRFEAWLKEAAPDGRPIFVGFNSPFDWMFVADYFHRYRGCNPFGHSALDIKSFYMGLKGVSWAETSMSRVSRVYLDGRRLSHNALEDALVQAELFEKMLDETLSGRPGEG